MTWRKPRFHCYCGAGFRTRRRLNEHIYRWAAYSHELPTTVRSPVHREDAA